MSEYIGVKIKEGSLKNLIIALQKKGINPRSHAEAVMVVINNFLIKQDDKKQD